MNERPRLTLTETKPLHAQPLTSAERDALLLSGADLTITPVASIAGRYTITPGSHVGAVYLDGLDVVIRPKLEMRNVLFLVAYAVDPRDWRNTDFDFKQNASLVEAIVPGFVRQVRCAFERGVLQGYRTEDDTLMTVRGRIRFDEQIQRRYGIVPPVAVRFDDFTEDIDLNRLIKAAIRRLSQLRLRSEVVRRSLRAFDLVLANVSHVRYDPRRLPSITYTRLNAHYRPAVALAKLILRATAHELYHGGVRSSSFLVDMNDVFQRFVVTALREALRLSPDVFPDEPGRRPLYLDHDRRIRLEPDLTWWAGRECTFVGDVKYKLVNVRGVKHPDIYQLLAYVTAANLSSGLLIYAAGEAEPVTHTIVYAGKRIVVRALDVSGTPDVILRQIDELAGQVRELRHMSVPALV